MGQCGGVINAIAHHRHGVPRGLQLLDVVHLVLGQDLSADVIDTYLGSHGAGGPGIIAGQQVRGKP